MGLHALREVNGLNFIDILDFIEPTAVHVTNKNFAHSRYFGFSWLSCFGISADQWH